MHTEKPLKKSIRGDNPPTRKKISIILCAYNESALLEGHLEEIAAFMETLASAYSWELIAVNDGSRDNTGAVLEIFAAGKESVKIIHHIKNQGLGKSLRDAFAKTTGDIVITLDADLSCSLDHIPSMLEKMEGSGAELVVASPTMQGGRMSHIPWHRRFLSRCANRFLSFFSAGRVSNLTHMVRAYDGSFIRSLNLRSEGMEIMPEMIYKAQILQQQIEEVPAHLDWSRQKGKRKSSMRLFSHTCETLFTGFLLKPFWFFIFPGLLLLLFSLYPNIWMMIHFFEEIPNTTGTSTLDHFSHALRAAYSQNPHTFFIGLISLLLSIQLIALGFQSLQSKHYYEELFNLATRILRSKRK